MKKKMDYIPVHLRTKKIALYDSLAKVMFTTRKRTLEGEQQDDSINVKGKR